MNKIEFSIPALPEDLGAASQAELQALRAQVAQLEQRVAVLEDQVSELYHPPTGLEDPQAPAPEPPAPPAPAPEPDPQAPPAPPAPSPAPIVLLRALSADPIQYVPKPPLGETYVDPAYGVTVRRVTDARGQHNCSYARHFYSRKQAINADSTKLLIWITSGHWHVHDIATGRDLGRLPLAGNCEAQWHPTDPDVVLHTANNGGLTWYALNVRTGRASVLFDLRGKLPWSNAARAWTKGEGCFSADGTKIALQVETDSFAMLGLAYVDIAAGKVHTMSTTSRPDHVSITPSGSRVVPSWVDSKGTRAYLPDFSAYVQLHGASEHSDLCMGPSGEDLLVIADYNAGQIRAIRCDVGASSAFDLVPLYPRYGSAYACHISGKAFGKPGWAVISTYADYMGHDPKRSPDTMLAPQYRKVFLAELKPGGRLLNLAHTRVQGGDYGGYFGEHQAVPNHDLSKVVFASNWGSGAVDDYVIDVPPL